MAEDTFLKMGREFFAREEASDLDITEKKLNKIWSVTIVLSRNRYSERVHM